MSSQLYHNNNLTELQALIGFASKNNMLNIDSKNGTITIPGGGYLSSIIKNILHIKISSFITKAITHLGTIKITINTSSEVIEDSILNIYNIRGDFKKNPFTSIVKTFFKIHDLPKIGNFKNKEETFLLNIGPDEMLLIKQSAIQTPCIPAPITPTEDFNSPPSFIIFDLL